MSDPVNLYQAKTHLSEPVECAAAGEEIVIARAGKLKAKLVPYEPPETKRRIGGQNLLGMTYMAPDWDDPLPEIQRYFDGESDPDDFSDPDNSEDAGDHK